MKKNLALITLSALGLSALGASAVAQVDSDLAQGGNPPAFTEEPTWITTKVSIPTRKYVYQTSRATGASATAIKTAGDESISGSGVGIDVSARGVGSHSLSISHNSVLYDESVVLKAVPTGDANFTKPQQVDAADFTNKTTYKLYIKKNDTRIGYSPKLEGDRNNQSRVYFTPTIGLMRDQLSVDCKAATNATDKGDVIGMGWFTSVEMGAHREIMQQTGLAIQFSAGIIHTHLYDESTMKVINEAGTMHTSRAYGPTNDARESTSGTTNLRVGLGLSLDPTPKMKLGLGWSSEHQLSTHHQHATVRGAYDEDMNDSIWLSVSVKI